MSEFKGITDRIALVKFDLGYQKIVIIQVYAPTVACEEKESDLS